MRTYQNITYGKLGLEAQKLDLYLPDCDSFKTFVYFHGGGIENGDKARPAESKLAEYLADRGIACVSVNYRMYPNTKYPEFICDCAEAVAWVMKNIDKYGKSEGVFVGGSSAGGYLSMMLCFDKKWLGEYGISPSDISGYVHDAGQPTAHFNVLKYSGIDPKRVIVDETAPLYHIGTDAEYSPLLFIVSDNDMQNRYEQTMLVMSTLKHFGHSDNKVELCVMHGTHCRYVAEMANDNSDKIFGKTIEQFIKKTV